MEIIKHKRFLRIRRVPRKYKGKYTRGNNRYVKHGIELHRNLFLNLENNFIISYFRCKSIPENVSKTCTFRKFAIL